jgi:uncharacterized protein YciI
MFFISSTYTAPPEKIEALLPAHRAWVDQHYQSGVFVLSGRLDPPTGGFMIARAIEKAALDALLACDPFRLEGCLVHHVQALVLTRSAAETPESWKVPQ